MVTTRCRHYAENQSFKARTKASERQQTKRVKNPPSSSTSFRSGDKHRDHVRETIVTALSKVAEEVGEEMADEVEGCDVNRVAVSMETALFEKLGLFKPLERPRLLKEIPIRMTYRRILYYLECTDSLDVRKKLVLGQLSPQDLVKSRL
ncbi:PREDICTED: transcription elongation factor TFIIS-like [Tarenaya hassleriana]|uniref:transcription elongation factor TFIIS-like n=1 Tax=Tarenaya hassleriana TaxID=28532 RepID=UPI00053C5B61|nr:PREDICTED: transcription elongation factor TFIIS-like [Tarenaya hassleriana]